MSTSFGSELDNRKVALALLGEESQRVQHVGFVVWPGYAELSMPDPKTVVNDDFKDHCREGTLIPTSEPL